jgi:hypothetical protein
MVSSGQRPSKAVRIGSLWYLAVPVLTAGMFTFLPFLHAAIRLRRVWVWAVALLFALISASTIYVSEQSDGALSDAVFAIVILGSLVVGVTLLTRLRREVYGLGAGRLDVTAEDTSEVDPAVRHVLEARAKRARARELAATDPLLARELHIGRPDLHSDYDDGGLVDIATAPESVIAQVLNLPDEQAAGIVAVRDTAITVDDLFTMTGLPLNTWEHIRDRAVIIR